MREGERSALWLGILIVVIAAAETWALPRKMRLVLARLEGHRSPTVTLFVLWMLHTVISILLLFTAVAAFGWDRDSSSVGQLPGWFLVLIVATVIKELYLLGVFFFACEATPAQASATPSDLEQKRPPDVPQRPRRLEPLLDGILLAYACIAYSSTWAAMFRQNEQYLGSNLALILFNVVAGAILFLLLYLPLRIPYWTEEIAQAQTRWDKAKLAFSLLLAMVPALVFL